MANRPVATQTTTNLRSSHCATNRIWHAQSGAVFVIALVLLSIMTLLGITATRNSSLEENMVRNNRDRQIAFLAAEAALLAGERNVEAAHPVFDDNCTNGYCTQGCPTKPRWSDPAKDVWNVAARHQTYAVQLPGNLVAPRYIIEDLCEYAAKSWREANPGATDLPQRAYRITALGTGGSGNARVMLQSTYVVTRVVNPACAVCNPATMASKGALTIVSAVSHTQAGTVGDPQKIVTH
ncbi:MAG: pilus assembly protein [Magnetococcus sp. MYC-9]